MRLLVLARLLINLGIACCATANVELVGVEEDANSTSQFPSISPLADNLIAKPKIAYFGGHVLTVNVKAHLVFYGDKWGKGLSHDTIVNSVTRFLDNLSKTKWYGATRSYFEPRRGGKKTHVYGHVSVGHIKTLKEKIFGKKYNSKFTLQVLNYVFQHRWLPVDENAVYFVITDSEYNSKGSGFCAHHTHGELVGKKKGGRKSGKKKKSNKREKVTKVAYAIVFGGSKRCKLQHAKSPVLDGMLSSVAHELTEMVTNPYGDGWHSPHDPGLENADLCATSYSNRKGAIGNRHNVEFKVGGKSYSYLIQDNWDYRRRKCVNR